MKSKDRTPIKFRADRTHESFVSYVWGCHPSNDTSDRSHRSAMFRALDYLAEEGSLRDWPRLCREVKEEAVLRETGTNRPLLKPRAAEPVLDVSHSLEDLPSEKSYDPPSAWYRTASTAMFGDPFQREREKAYYDSITEIKTDKQCPTIPRP